MNGPRSDKTASMAEVFSAVARPSPQAVVMVLAGVFLVGAALQN